MKREAPFDSAARAVDAWLRAEPGLVLDASQNHASWTLRVQHPLIPKGWLRLLLPKGFPGVPAQVEVDPGLCLALPHVESTGRYCHGVVPAPSDFADPVGAVARVLGQVQDLLLRSEDPAWRHREFARESSSYWYAFGALAQSKATGVAPAFVLEVDGSKVSGWATGELEAFVAGPSNRRRIVRALAAPGEGLALAIAKRHGRAHGTHVRGKALFIRLDSKESWTPQEWPKHLAQLDALVRDKTEGLTSLGALLEGNSRRSRCAALVLLHGDATYSYMLASAAGQPLARASLCPVMVRRIDPVWVLSRDRVALELRRRESLRVLVVGCGSLGAPVAEQLARSGIAELAVVDDQSLEPENTGRHTLGLMSVGISKAKALRDRIEAASPGIKVTAHNCSFSELLEASPPILDYDLVVDCTGEAAVRCAISAARMGRLSAAKVLLAWIEPYCAAAHVVGLDEQSNWPIDDPADTQVNAGAWPDYNPVVLPVCGAGFHPYGMADVSAAAAFVTHRVLAVLDGVAKLPAVWSRVRSKEYFEQLPVSAAPRDFVPLLGSPLNALELERPLTGLFRASDTPG